MAEPDLNPLPSIATDTIVAISTPPGRGGIGIVRLSGPQAADIAIELVQLHHPLEHARARRADVLDVPETNDGEPKRIDEAVVTFFAAPNSYTSDDLVEIAAHGSPVVLDLLLRRALDLLTAGDVFMVTKLDRLARSTRDLLNTLATITERKAGFRSLGDAWADTTTPHGRLMLTVLGGLAEFDRELIRARTGEGRARAKALGKSLGRPFKMTPHQRKEALARRERGELLTEIARSYNVSAATISRLAT